MISAKERTGKLRNAIAVGLPRAPEEGLVVVRAGKRSEQAAAFTADLRLLVNQVRCRVGVAFEAL